MVIFFNAADEDLDMSASLAELFVMHGPGGSADEVKQDWTVRDLWGSEGARMSKADAQAVLDAKSDAERRSVLKRANWYNATEKPYAKGLEDGDERLFGERVGTVKAGGRLEARVARHAAKVFRLQSAGGKAGAPKGSSLRDEL